MDEKLKNTIEKIYILSQQNSEFDIKLRKRLEIIPESSSLFEDERMNHIYEYCIEKIIRKQAEEFYADFPLKSIKDILIEDFIRMESFKRKDNFGDFCLSLYQQIECMTNRLSEKKELEEITSKMWGHPAYVKVEKGKESSISERIGDFSIASLIFPGNSKQSGFTNAFEKSKKSFQSQYAIDKIRTIVYFMGYKAMMKGSDYDSFIEITTLLNEIYQCRNMNHRGNTLNQWEKDVLDKVLPLKSFYYFKFLGVLAQYVEYIKNGYSSISYILEYCQTITIKKIDIGGPQIKGNISLDELERRDGNKKRFK